MTTIINTPPSGESSDSGVGLVIGVIVALVLIALFFLYALPAIRNNIGAKNPSSIDVNVKLPTNSGSTPAPSGNATTY